jgi:hypothetical protein
MPRVTAGETIWRRLNKTRATTAVVEDLVRADRQASEQAAPLSLTLSRIRLRQGFGGHEGGGNPAVDASLTRANHIRDSHDAT